MILQQKTRICIKHYFNIAFLWLKNIQFSFKTLRLPCTKGSLASYSANSASLISCEVEENPCINGFKLGFTAAVRRAPMPVSRTMRSLSVTLARPDTQLSIFSACLGFNDDLRLPVSF